MFKNNFEKITVVLLSLCLLFLVTIKMDTCTLSNDVRTQKKTTKRIEENTITVTKMDSITRKLENTIFSKVDTTNN